MKLPLAAAVCSLLALVAGTRTLSAQDAVPVRDSFALPLGGESVDFFRERSRVEGEGPLVLALHRNESTSFPIVRALLRHYPGQFIGIASPGGRRLSLKGNSHAFTIDPNRMFSEAGIARDLRRFSFHSPDIVEEILRFSDDYVRAIGLNDRSVVIAVHNNTNGGYSATSYLDGGSESAAGAKVSLRDGLDTDDFVLVTNPAHFDALVAQGFNVVLQDNRNAPDDGSLSVFCGRSGLDYFNVEAEFGHAEQQDRMLRAVFALATGAPAAGAPAAGAPAAGGPAVDPVVKPVENPAIQLDDPAEGSPGRDVAGDEREGIRRFLPRPGLREIKPRGEE